MKIIYCCPSDDISRLKTAPEDYTSSKINTLFTQTEPYFHREFLSVGNIHYIKIRDYPDYKRLWDDMMNKVTFAYNFRYLESNAIFAEYKEFNRRYGDEINGICEPDDLLVINDSSLYLLPSMVRCRVAVRNIRFDDCFIERVPFFKEVLTSLFRAEKFFVNKRSLNSFHRYLETSYDFMHAESGGASYMRPYIDKEAVLDVLKVCTAYMDNFGSTGTLKNNALIEHLGQLAFPKECETLLTNVPLLHLEAFIKKHPRINIRYIRESVEIDVKQDRMIQYLKKAYNCRIDVIDQHDFDIITLEMLYCGVFVGSAYTELARLLRKPYLVDDIDPMSLSRKIEPLIGKMQERMDVCGEDQYLQDFLAINGYDMHHDIDTQIDDQIELYLLELAVWMKGDVRRVSELMPSDESACSCGEDACAECRGAQLRRAHERGGSGFRRNVEEFFEDNGLVKEEDILYEKTINGEKVLYKKRSNRRTASTVRPKERREKLPQADLAEKFSQRPRKKECCDEQECSCDEDERVRKPMKEPRAIDFAKIKEFWDASGKTALLDYDGTLTEIKKLPHEAAPTPELFERLRRFQKNARLVICTGRSEKVVDEWFPKEFEVFAEHGAAHRRDGKWSYRKKIPHIDECLEIMEYYKVRTPNTVVERKSHGAAFHYKLVKDFDISKMYYLLKRLVGNAVVVGKDVIEIRSCDKYAIAKWVKPALVAGDDTVDEDMYDGCDGVSVRVGTGKTKADYYVETVPEFISFLDALAGEGRPAKA